MFCEFHVAARAVAAVIVRAVRTALATAASGESPYRSVSVKRASALITIARSRSSPFAEAIPGARFHLLTATGHVPQIETFEQLLREVWDFADLQG